MTERMQGGDGRGNPWRLAAWAAAALVLLVPLVSMQLGGPFDWDETDFLLMAALIGGAGAAIELAVRQSRNLNYLAAAGLAVLAAFLLVWVNLAVGFLGSEDNPANLMFLGVIAIAVTGSVAVRGRASSMAGVLLVTAAAQALAGLIGLAAGLSSPGAQGLYEVAMGTSLFGALWLSSAWLFRRAGRAEGVPNAVG